jgi:hypothetical protein
MESPFLFIHNTDPPRMLVPIQEVYITVFLLIGTDGITASLVCSPLYEQVWYRKSDK